MMQNVILVLMSIHVAMAAECGAHVDTDSSTLLQLETAKHSQPDDGFKTEVHHEFVSVDYDNDGKLTKREAGLHPELKEIFVELDLNKDGVITEDEYYQDEVKSTQASLMSESEGASSTEGKQPFWGRRGRTSAPEAWRVSSTCAWFCKQGWFWQSTAYGKPACCGETYNSGSPYESCQHAGGCSCDALCRSCCELQATPTKGAPNPNLVFLNEIMPRPAEGKEWIEVYNAGSCAVDVSSWQLVDRAGFAGAWSSHTLAANSYAIVEFSRKLNNDGDEVRLIDGHGVQVDAFEYTSSSSAKTWMRMPDGEAWSKIASTPTKGFANPSTSSSPVSKPGNTSRGCGENCDDGLCFATWNVQNLGKSKGRRPAVIKAIQTVLRRYEFVAIQELSQKPKAPFVCGENTESVICAVRPDPDEYTVIASPRIGDEQYSVIFANSAARVSGAGATYPDASEVHSRPPHAFDVTVTKGSNDFKFTVGLTHTSPKSATKEIHNFPNVLSWMQREFDAHTLLVGDFNAGGSYFKDEQQWPDSQLPTQWNGFKLLTPNELDTTVAKNDNTYDRIIADTQLASKSGIAAVFKLENLDLSAVRTEGCANGYVPSSACSQSLNGMSWDEFPDSVKTLLAKELSDHHPVEVCLRG